MTNWKEYKLGELVAINERSIGRNFEFKSIEYIDTSSVTENKFDTPIYTTISEAPSRAKRLIANGDTIISTVRPIQKHYGFIKKAKANQVVSTGFAVVTPKRIDPRFLYYFLTQAEITEFLNTIAEGGTTTFPAFRAEELKDLPINLPDLPTQTAIAEILSSLDDKIELNNKINQELENLAQTLFKHWFIDFEFPNENGEPYRSSGGIMVDSELGKIPKGWKVDLLNTIFDFLEGPGLRNWQYTKEGMPFINIRLIQNGDINIEKSSFISKQEFETKYKHFELHEFDFIVSTSGTLGKSAIVRKSHLPLMLNTSVIRFKPLKPNSKCYMYQYLQSESFLDELTTQASGSVQLNFGPMHLNRINMIIPNDSIIENYEEIVNNVYEKIISNREENNYLSNLRDTLLPKLISGELEVSDIQSNTL